MRMKEASTGPLYDLWSWFYDVTFGALVHKRQERALEQVRPSPGDRVLDLGVGTGMTLPHYPSNVEVVGMDLSAGMLAKAAEKRAQQNLEHCQLVLADAMHVPFADQSFDHIVISHTISVVSDANRLLRERLRADARESGFEVWYPRLEFCTDNAAMIAYAGWLRLRGGETAGPAVRVRPRWPLAELAGDWTVPGVGKTVSELARTVDRSGLRRVAPAAELAPGGGEGDRDEEPQPEEERGGGGNGS